MKSGCNMHLHSGWWVDVHVKEFPIIELFSLEVDTGPYFGFLAAGKSKDGGTTADLFRRVDPESNGDTEFND